MFTDTRIFEKDEDTYPKKRTDYRRTLYWNPNVRTDADANFGVTFYNNCRETEIKISAAGVTSDGGIIYY